MNEANPRVTWKGLISGLGDTLATVRLEGGKSSFSTLKLSLDGRIGVGVADGNGGVGVGIACT